MPGLIEYIRAGRLRALAVCTATRSHALPDVPTVSEFVPGYESSGYFGFGAPARTPAGIIDKLNKEINAGLADPKVKTRLVLQSFDPTLLVSAVPVVERRSRDPDWSQCPAD